MNEPTLFDAPVVPISAFSGKPVAHARNTDPITSHEAAQSVDVTKSQKLILRAARAANSPKTALQLRQIVVSNGRGISDSGARTRCRELVDLGLMREAGHHMKHAMYVLTDRGYNAAYQAALEDKAA